ncbi:MAG: DUF1799 domain-containing protein [Candidatus Accumulibacter sp.]|nr:DUF1799 domain-containing protein [Accumulibacter sp.]
MAAFGLWRESGRARLRQPPPTEVYAHNWPAFEVWSAVWRQWKWLGGGFAAPVRIGLDWTQVEAVMRMKGMRKRTRARVMNALGVMEDAALEVIARRAQDKR